MRALALLLLFLLASPATAATVRWFDSGETGTPDTPASLAQFPGGINAARPPIFRANNGVFLGVGNRIYLDFDSTLGSSYGTWLAGTAYSEGAIGAYVSAQLGPIAKCIGGGAKAGLNCYDSSQCTAGASIGYCQAQRRPFLQHATASVVGCALYHQQSCSAVHPTTRVCSGASHVATLLFGGPQLSGGICGASETMTDTPCGGACSSVAQCLPGRPNETDPTTSTACVLDYDPTTACGCVGGTNAGATCTVASQCPGGSCPACHCINECDERRPGEATCTPGSYGSIVLQADVEQAIVIGQINESDPGKVTCVLNAGVFGPLCLSGANAGAECTVASQCPGGTCTPDQPIVFERGRRTRKVGLCAGGSALAIGGKNNLACGTDADCACNTLWPTFGCQGGANASAACSTASQCPGGTCSGACAAGTCSTTARITPDRMTWSYDDTNTQAGRWLMDHFLTQTGSDPTTAWRAETLLVDGDSSCAGGSNGGATCTTASQCPGSSCTALTTGWDTASRCVSGDYLCMLGNGTPATEPDGNTTYALETTNGDDADWIHEWTFANPAATSDTPIAVSLSVAANDSEGANNDGIGIELTLRDAAASVMTCVAGANAGARCTTASQCPSGTCGVFDLATFDGKFCVGGANLGATCSVSSECPSSTCDDHDGASGGYYPTLPLVLNAEPTGAALTAAALNGLIGKVRKRDLHGAGDAGRITLAALQLAEATTPAVPSDILPGNKRVSIIDDSTGNDPLLYTYLTGIWPEPSNLNDAARGGIALGDVVRDAPYLFEGQDAPGGMDTAEIVGTAGPIDVAFIKATINTVHAGGIGSADPAGPALYDGIGQNGSCEDWTAAGGFGARQSLPCACPEVQNWETTDALTSICMLKNGLFGLVTPFCLCGSNADCTIGKPSPTGTPTATTCQLTPSQGCPFGGCCVSSKSDLKVTAPAATRAWGGNGCTPATGAIGCGGVCQTTNSQARMLRAKRHLEEMAAVSSAPNGTTLVWLTSPLANGKTYQGVRTGWFETRADVEAWRGTLLDEQKRIDGPWVDLYAYFVERCGDGLLLPNGTTPCIKSDGVHYDDEGNALYAEAVHDCGAHVRGVTDGACSATAGGACQGGACTNGIRKGFACAVDADCRHCTAGALLKRGQACTADQDCGRYYCPFPP